MKTVWDSPELIMVITALIGDIILFIIVILYNHFIIKPNLKSPVFIVRRPTFCVIFMLCCVLSAIIRCIVSFIIVLYPNWQISIYNLISRACVYFGTFTFAIVRMWLLYYDVNCHRKKQNHLLSKYLHLKSKKALKLKDGHIATSNIGYYKQRSKQYLKLNSKSSTNNDDHEKQSNGDKTDIDIDYGKYHQFYGNAKAITSTIILFAAILLVLGIFLDSEPVANAQKYTNVICKSVGFGFWLFYGYLLIKLYQNNATQNTLKRSFNDDWNLLSELVGLWMLWFFVVCVEILLPFLYQFNYIDVYYGPLSIFTFFWQTMNVSLCILTPWRILKEINNDKTSSNSKNVIINSLENILRENQSFFDFVSFSKQEASIENVAFLVEVWQFKYQNLIKYKKETLDISENDESKTSKTTMNDRKRWSSLSKADCFGNTLEDIIDIEVDIGASTGTSLDVIDDIYDDTNSMDEAIVRGLEFPGGDILEEEDIKKEYKFIYPSANEVNSPLPLFNQTSLEKRKMTVNMLKSMPWADLPLNEIISKYKNNKWIQCNIIYNKYIVRDAQYALNISHAGFVETETLYKQCMNLYEQNNKDIFNKSVLTVFDVVVPEIFDNLDNVATRFRSKPIDQLNDDNMR